MDQRYIKLYDQYTHSTMSRRDFVEKLTKLTGSAALTASVLPFLENNYAHAATVPEGDDRMSATRIAYMGPKGEMKAYLARPEGKGVYPAVVVIHENRGLNAHIEDVARRLAVAGFVALAVDALSPAGGTPDDMEKARVLIEGLNMPDTRANYLAAVQYLKTHPAATGKVGCVGFCWGGSMANQLAVHAPDLLAAVAYYGGQPAVADVPKIKAAVLLHYAGLDERINKGMPAYVAALKEAGVKHQSYLYEGVNHAFNNDTNAARYDEKAAKLAWERTLRFLSEQLA